MRLAPSDTIIAIWSFIIGKYRHIYELLICLSIEILDLVNQDWIRWFCRWQAMFSSYVRYVYVFRQLKVLLLIESLLEWYMNLFSRGEVLYNIICCSVISCRNTVRSRLKTQGLHSFEIVSVGLRLEMANVGWVFRVSINQQYQYYTNNQVLFKQTFN